VICLRQGADEDGGVNPVGWEASFEPRRNGETEKNKEQFSVAPFLRGDAVIVPRSADSVPA
jgi:hypothetical protein